VYDRYCYPSYHHHHCDYGFSFGFSYWRDPYYYGPAPVIYTTPYPFYGFGGVVTEVVAAPVVVPQPVYYAAPPVAVAAAPPAPMPLPAPAEQVAPPVVEQPVAPQAPAAGPAPALEKPAPAPAAEPQPVPAPAPEEQAAPAVEVPSETAPAPAAEPPSAAESATTARPSSIGASSQAPTTQPAISEEFVKHMNAGAEAFAGGKYDEARRSFASAMATDSENVDAHLAFALAHFALGDYATTARTLREVIPAYPLIVHSQFDLRQQYKIADDLTKQVAKLRDHIKAHPKDVDAMLVLGFVQHFGGQREDARKVFAEVQRLSKDDGVAKVFVTPPPLPQATTQPAAATTAPAATTPTTRPADASVR
jgi:TolA-binding protein